MPITTEDNIAGGYVGDGTTNAVATPHFQKNADIRAVQVTDATGAELVLVLDTDYTLTGAGSPGGGSLTPLAARPVGTTLYVTVDPAQTQEATIAESEPTTDAVDKNVQLIQALQLQIDRAFKLPEGDRLAGSVASTVAAGTASSRAFDLMGFDGNGAFSVLDVFGSPTPIASSATYDPSTHYGRHLLLDVDAADVALTLPDASTIKDGIGFWLRTNSNANTPSVTVAVAGQLRSRPDNGVTGHDVTADTVYIGYATAAQASAVCYVWKDTTTGATPAIWQISGMLRDAVGDDYRITPGAGSGDMLAATYDPQSISGDAFARANHTGTQAISTITNLQSTLDNKSDNGHSHVVANVSGLTAELDQKDDLITLSGLAAGSTDLGTFTGTTITDNVAVKVAFQELETAVEAAGGGGGGSLDNVVEDTTPQLGGSLDVNGQSIVSVSNGNIPITPDGTGAIVLDGLSWPTSDGTNGQVIKTDGAGNLTFQDDATGGGGGGLDNVVEDLTPQLGGDLDVNGNDIVSTSNGNIVLTPDGTGKVQLDGLFWPTADGTNGQVPKTDGSGNLTFADVVDQDLASDLTTITRSGLDASSDLLLVWDDSASQLKSLAWSELTEALTFAASDETTDLTTGTGKLTFRMPFAMTLTGVRASVGTAPTGSILTVDINEGGTSVLSTKLTIDAGEKTSTTAATPAVISDSSLSDDAEMTIDIDQIGSTVAGKGLKVTLIGTRP